MNLFEKVKNFLGPSIEDETVPEEKIINSFDSDIHSTGAFFDDSYNSVFNTRDKVNMIEKQRAKITLYRGLSKTEEVFEAIDEITNEIVYSDEKEVLKLQLDEENEKIEEAVQTAFTKVKKLIDVKKNLYNIVRQTYVDGQALFHCEYSKDLKDGIKKIKMLDPIYFYFDKKSDKYKYYESQSDFGISTQKEEIIFDREEIINANFGLVEDRIVISYLEYAVKSANQLKTLEDLLIPLRFSRSISRRVFNVDTGELQNTKSEQAMREIQKKFKYKKFYNTSTGEITNQQHITSMVEDYWFANRSGAKGTTVEVMDETGNLGEINDILYFQKKLYKSMKIPSNRISNNTDSDQNFDYDSTQVTREDMKFFMFISRLRPIFIDIFKELLKRELISTEVMSLEHYDEYAEKINIVFVSENMFLEKIKLANFSRKLDLYSTVQEYNGKLFPVEKVLKDVFNFTDEEIEENFAMISKEKTDPKYKAFYQTDDGSDF